MGDEDPGEFLKNLEAKSAALDIQLQGYIEEWRKQREAEEEELVKLKEKQAARKVMREEEDKKMAERKKAEEERKARETEEKKQKELEEKRKRLEEAEKKRQAMMAALKEQKSKGPTFVMSKKEPGLDLKVERTKTKEQLEEEKRISLSVRIKPLANLDDLSIDRLRLKAMELWDLIIKLETEKYDLEEKMKLQEYDLKELKERQRQQLRHKALKRGLDPEALTGRYPPKIDLSSKYERRVDTRSYEDKKSFFEGGYMTLSSEEMEKVWKTRAEQFAKRRRRKLPRWFGERPGKKPDAPESPEEEEVAPEEEKEVYIPFLSDEEPEAGEEGEEGEEEEEEDDDEEEEEEDEEDE